MKLTKKLAGILLALAMVLGLAATALAAGGNTITVKNAVKDQTYKLYKMLDLVVNDALNAYSYTVNSAWTNFFVISETNTTAPGAAYVNIDAQGYVTWKDGTDVAAFAKDAEEFAKNRNALQTHTATADGDFTFTGLEAGYYLVTSSLGTKATVGTTPGNPNPEIQEKNAVPENVKNVQEDSNSAWGEKNDADIGQVVNFKSTITAQPGAENYVFHDTMSAGLTLDKASIKVEGVAVTDAQGNDVAGDNYTVSYPSGEGSDGCTFEIAFAQSYLDTIKAATPITITYSATLNENAKVGLEGNPNESKLSYGVADSTTGEPSGTTPPSKTTTYTWDMDVLKYGNNDKNNVLKDAKFVLLNSAKTQVATIVNGKVTGWTAVPTVAEGATITWPANTVLTTDANGKIEIDGLDADTYYLREVEAPAGYNKLAEDQVVAITGATKVDEVLTYSTVVAEINNQSGIELPSTGGIGTTIFYIVGGVLVVGAVVLLVTKKRMGNVER